MHTSVLYEPGFESSRTKPIRWGVYLQIKLALRRLFRRGVYSSSGAKSIIYGNCAFAWKKGKNERFILSLGKLTLIS